MPRIELLDAESGLHVETAALGPGDLPGRTEAGEHWSITKETLGAGRSAGVDRIRVDNGRLEFDVVPTRGMGLWAARLGSTRVGWRSPVTDGPIHPALVPLEARGGLGWLQGFDELLARCGLESNGPPNADAAGRIAQTLHGRIANIPARKVAIEVGERAPRSLAVEGEVDEVELFFNRLRLATRIETEIGSNRLTLTDRVTNLRGVASGFQLLYHWNLGPPQLEAGSQFLAPIQALCPRDATAAAGLSTFHLYGPPQPVYPEQVFYFRLHAAQDGQTVVLLRNQAGDSGVALRFGVAQLPCFTLWKCTQSEQDGYVTGLEPAVNYPNPRAFEQARGRVPILQPGESASFTTVLEVLTSRAEVSHVATEIQGLQEQGGPPVVYQAPSEPFAPAS